MDRETSEPLLLLILREDTSEKVALFADRSFSVKTNAYKTETKGFEVKPVEGFWLMLTFELIRAYNRVPKFEEFADRIYAFPDFTKSKYQENIDALASQHKMGSILWARFPLASI